MGWQALAANTASTDNTAIGPQALSAHTSGFGNVAIGRAALVDHVTGDGNTAVGGNALDNLVTGSNNLAIGASAGFSATAGSNNVYLGANAGFSATTGSNNIYIGDTGAAAESNTIRIGGVGQTATFIAGIDGVAVGASSTVLINASGQLGTMVSTRRVKQDIRDMGKTSSGLRRLRPVVFRYRQPSADGSKPIQYGLIAEEVAEVMPELVVYDAEGQPQTVQYHVLPALLLNELQRQHSEVDKLRALLEQQKAELAELRAALRATLAQR